MVGGMMVIKIKPGHREHLLEALKEHGRVAFNSEPGLVRFDIYPDPDDADSIWFYEAYVDQEAFELHLESPSHVEQWSNFGRDHCTEEWPQP